MSAFEANVDDGPGRAHGAASSSVARLGAGAAALLTLAAFYAIEHPYAGILGDAKIYMGRALADLDASGVGRDLMFRLDGQSQFSVFTPAARWLAAHLSFATSAALIAALGGALWFAGALAFARQALTGRELAIAAIVFAAPAVYGPDRLLTYAEMLAEPRPYAEAFTLLALAAFLAHRLGLAFALLAVAAALHPIMALAGVAAISLALCVEDRRWLIAAGVGCIGFAGAVALDAPIAGRLRVFVDPQWLSLLMDRNTYLFPHLYDADDLILPLVRGATIMLAANYADGRLRRILVAGLIASVLGVTVAWIVGAALPSLLALQAQTWRMWWLTGFLAAFSLGYCAVRMGRGSPREKFSLAMLALAWAMASQGPVVLVALVIAIYVTIPRFSAFLTITDKIAGYTWLAVAATIAIPTAVMLGKWLEFPTTEGFDPVFTKRLLVVAGDAILVGTVAFAALGVPKALARLPQMAVFAGALCAIAVGARLWTDPDSYARALAEARVQGDLARMTPRDGEILWLKSSLEPWVWLRRPHWLGDIQGAGIVFSRDLATRYRERADALAAAGLDNGALVRRYANLPKQWFFNPDRKGVTQICGRADAPAYIIAPVASDAKLDPALDAKLWTAPALRVEMTAVGDQVETARIGVYAVIDCARNR
ncbi:MAG: hypothetical protein KDJ25_12530 [Rhodoblastus sp.]|nr:hypothetical protein [Rhodoblastus sp.]